MDVETFLEMEKKGEPSRSSAMQYFSGAKEGVYYLNAALKEHYFCLPPNLELSNEEARNIALQMASKAISGGTGNPDIVAALILGLKEKFPCEGKSPTIIKMIGRRTATPLGAALISMIIRFICFLRNLQSHRPQPASRLPGHLMQASQSSGNGPPASRSPGYQIQASRINLRRIPKMGGRGRDSAHMARARAKRAPFTNARDGRVKRQVRWAFWMSGGSPMTTTELLRHCYFVTT